jgi:hypothetical protein
MTARNLCHVTFPSPRVRMSGQDLRFILRQYTRCSINLYNKGYPSYYSARSRSNYHTKQLSLVNQFVNNYYILLL